MTTYAKFSIKMLEIISNQYFQLASSIKSVSIKLADLGVILQGNSPVVLATDPMQVVRLKEQVVAFKAKQIKISNDLIKKGAQLLNPETFEIIITDEPVKRFFLSWQPGEKGFFFYREHATLNSKRHTLQNKNILQTKQNIQSTIH